MQTDVNKDPGKLETDDELNADVKDAATDVRLVEKRRPYEYQPWNGCKQAQYETETPT
jgi:hypothetical protein